MMNKQAHNLYTHTHTWIHKCRNIGSGEEGRRQMKKGCFLETVGSIVGNVTAPQIFHVQKVVCPMLIGLWLVRNKQKQIK